MPKIDKYDFKSIINIKFMFKNSKYNQQQSIKKWKKENRESVLQYHKNYNIKNNIPDKVAGYCNCCNNYYKNLCNHLKSFKHLQNNKIYNLSK
jgi:hypothetical protein